VDLNYRDEFRGAKEKAERAVYSFLSVGRVVGRRWLRVGWLPSPKIPRRVSVISPPWWRGWRRSPSAWAAVTRFFWRIVMSTVASRSFFHDLTTKNMSEPERVVYLLKLDREALLRSAKKFHWKLLHIKSFVEPGPAQDQALQKLNEKYPLGYSRKELDAVNCAIAKAIVDLNNYQANNLKDGQHFNTRKSPRQSWRDF
jgi:hypothetical protein